jgi:hypothetical protein
VSMPPTAGPETDPDGLETYETLGRPIILVKPTQTGPVWWFIHTAIFVAVIMLIYVNIQVQCKQEKIEQHYRSIESNMTKAIKYNKERIDAISRAVKANIDVDPEEIP